MRAKLVNFTQIRNLTYKQLMSWYSGLYRAKPLPPPYTHIVQIGDPILRSPSKPVPLENIESPQIGALIAPMTRVFHKYKCVGLSAPQIGLNYRVIMFELDRQLEEFTQEQRQARNMKKVEFTVVVNPEVKVAKYERVVYTEGCESIKGFCAEVPRYSAIKLTGFRPNGLRFEMDADGWMARVIQHEMDHLDGILYTDKMIRNSLSCSCWQVVNERRGKVELPYYY